MGTGANAAEEAELTARDGPRPCSDVDVARMTQDLVWAVAARGSLAVPQMQRRLDERPSTNKGASAACLPRPPPVHREAHPVRWGRRRYDLRPLATTGIGWRAHLAHRQCRLWRAPGPRRRPTRFCGGTCEDRAPQKMINTENPGPRHRRSAQGPVASQAQ